MTGYRRRKVADVIARSACLVALIVAGVSLRRLVKASVGRGIGPGGDGSNRDNSPLSEWIAYGFDITVLLVTERILPVFAKEAKVL